VSDTSIYKGRKQKINIMKTTYIFLGIGIFLMVVMIVLIAGMLNIGLKQVSIGLKQLDVSSKTAPSLGGIEVNMITGNGTFSSSTVATTSPGTLVSAVDPGIRYRRICNDTLNVIYLFETAATSGIAVGKGYKLNASGSSGDCWETTPAHFYTGDVYAIASGSPSQVSIIKQK
jgi:hypothetical protein